MRISIPVTRIDLDQSRHEEILEVSDSGAGGIDGDRLLFQIGEAVYCCERKEFTMLLNALCVSPAGNDKPKVFSNYGDNSLWSMRPISASIEFPLDATYKFTAKEDIREGDSLQMDGAFIKVWQKPETDAMGRPLTILSQRIGVAARDISKGEGAEYRLMDNTKDVIAW